MKLFLDEVDPKWSSSIRFSNGCSRIRFGVVVKTLIAGKVDALHTRIWP